MSLTTDEIALDFCEYCNGGLTSSKKLVTVYRHRKGRHFIFEKVPAQVCQRCGERYFAAQVVRDMDTLMRKPERSSSTVKVLVMTLKPVR